MIAAYLNIYSRCAQNIYTESESSAVQLLLKTSRPHSDTHTHALYYSVCYTATQKRDLTGENLTLNKGIFLQNQSPSPLFCIAMKWCIILTRITETWRNIAFKTCAMHFGRDTEMEYVQTMTMTTKWSNLHELSQWYESA